MPQAGDCRKQAITLTTQVGIPTLDAHDPVNECNGDVTPTVSLKLPTVPTETTYSLSPGMNG